MDPRQKVRVYHPFGDKSHMGDSFSPPPPPLPLPLRSGTHSDTMTSERSGCIRHWHFTLKANFNVMHFQGQIFSIKLPLLVFSRTYGLFTFLSVCNQSMGTVTLWLIRTKIVQYCNRFLSKAVCVHRFTDAVFSSMFIEVPPNFTNFLHYDFMLL